MEKGDAKKVLRVLTGTKVCFISRPIAVRALVGNLKPGVPITSKSSKFKGATQHYVVKLPKSAGARHYCTKILWVPGKLQVLKRVTY